MFGASQFMFTAVAQDCVLRTLHARRSGPRGGMCGVMTGLGGLGLSLPYRDSWPNSRGVPACLREIHGDPNFAGRVANRVGARHCVGDSYSYWRRLTRHAERTDWPA